MARDKLTKTLARSWRSEDDTAREILEIVNQLKSSFEPRNRLYEHIENIIYQRLPVSVPDAYRATAIETRSPLATHIANTVTAALSVNQPQVIFEPVNTGDTAFANSTLREKFFEASFRRQEEEARRRIFRSFMYSLVTKGEAVLKTLTRHQRAWAEYTKFARNLSHELDSDPTIDDDTRKRIFDQKTEEFKRAAPYPIITTDVPPETFYYIKSEDGFTFACEYKYIPYYDALARYGDRFGLSRDGRIVPAAMGLPRHEAASLMRSFNGMLTMVEAWTWDQVTYILLDPVDSSSGMIVKRIPHTYGNPYTKTLRGPYFHALGLTTASRLPQYAGMSVLFPFLDLFPLLDSLLTIQSNAAFLFGFPSFKEQVPETAIFPGQAAGSTVHPDDGTETGQYERIEPGRIYPANIAPVELPKAGVELDKLLARITMMLEHALPAAATGSLQGDPSGYAFNQAAYMARLAWQPIVENAEFALAERVGFESWLIEHVLKEPVSVWGTLPHKKGVEGWLTIGPDDLRNVHRYKVRLDPETPANKVVLVRMHSELLRLKLEGPYTAIEALGGNPDEVEREWLLYELKQSPEIKRALMKRVFQKLGTADKELLGGDEAAAAALGLAPKNSEQVQDNSFLGQLGQVFQAGQNLPITPTPPGSIQGAGLRAGTPPGTPVTPNVPARHEPLPGETLGE